MTPRSCVVTGSAGGIGAGIVARLSADGWLVVGIDQNASPDTAASPVITGDVADPRVHDEAAHVAAGLGSLQGWVNCAGYNVIGRVDLLAQDELERGVAVNLLGYFHGTAAAVRSRMATGDRQPLSIVNISSIHAAVGFPGFAAYAMAKGGIDALSRQVAAEFIADGIRCNVVAPGLIASPMNDRLLAESTDPEGQTRAWRALTPMGRWGQPDDVAAAVAFLMDPRESGYITGETLHVSGGALRLARGLGE